MTWIWIIAVLFGGTPTEGPDAVPSELVASWSQATYDEGVPSPVASTVIDDEQDRAAFLDRLPDHLPRQAVEQVDLTEHVLVVGGYHNCQQSSFVERDAAGLVLVATDTPEGLACAWSPYTVDVHAVAR